MNSRKLLQLRFANCTLMIFLLPAWILAAPPGEGPQVELLWSRGAPGAVGQEDADKPTLSIYLPPAERTTGTAVVVCPGGAYRALAMDHEGRQVAEWLNSFGVAAFVLKYRIAPRYHHPAPMMDAQRGVRTVRARAREWGIDPARIGILGFSAGGHLASTAGTYFDAGQPEADDPIDRAGSRPDFMVLVYPVISFTTEYTHQGSRNNLLGPSPSAELLHQFSNETQVTPQTPPTFLIHTSGDKGVPAENSVLFYLALRRANVPAEMHIFEEGEHGFGLAPQDPVLSAWPNLCKAWMERRGLLKK